MVAQLAEIRWPRGRIEHVRTRVSGEVRSKAIAVREELSKQVRATAAPRKIANRLALAIAVPVGEIPASAVGGAERATRAQIVEVETV